MNTCWRSPAKEGWFCPSCHQKKVQVFGAMLAESIVAVVPHRHFTFTISKMLRPYFRFQLGFNLDSIWIQFGLLKQLCRIAQSTGPLATERIECGQLVIELCLDDPMPDDDCNPPLWQV